MSARSDSNNTAWVSRAWMHRALLSLQGTLDVNPDLKTQMVQFLLDAGFWNAEKLSWDAAIGRFNACLNPGRGENFKIIEVWALMRQFERFELLEVMAEDLGFELRRRPTEERRQDLIELLVRELRRSNDLAQLTAETLAQFGVTAPPRRIHAAISAGTGSFDMPASSGTAGANWVEEQSF